MNEECPDNAGLAYFTTKTPSGKAASVKLCLLTMEFGKGVNKQQLIPYRVDENNMLWGAEKYSYEVLAYEKERASQFVLSPEDENWIEQEKSSQYWSNWRESLVNLAIGLMIFAAVVWGIGWIVRGFMGIPQSMDKKPSIDT